jgi:hypothetical protein
VILIRVIGYFTPKEAPKPAEPHPPAPPEQVASEPTAPEPVRVVATPIPIPPPEEVPPEKAPPEQKSPWTLIPNDIVQGSLRYRIVSIRVGTTEYTEMFGERKHTKDPGMEIVVDVFNESKSKLINYRAWYMEDDCRLRDELLNWYPYTSEYLLREPVGRTAKIKGVIYPGKKIRDVLTFGPPVDDAKSFGLALRPLDPDESELVMFALPVRSYLHAGE